MDHFLIGMIAMSFAVAGGFFLRFWKDTRDRLFGVFALAFFVLALNRTALAFANTEGETIHYLYLIRLIGFVLILLALIDKNLWPKRS